MNSSNVNDVLLLCFRGSKHYWPLCIRQLVLLPGMSGESFPYRKQYIVEEIAPQKKFPLGLICMKFDASEVVDGPQERQSVYVPLRFVTDVVGDFAKDSSLLYFTYTLGSTVDYRDRTLTHYSAEIRDAVLEALKKRGLQHPDDDRSLVLGVCLDRGPQNADPGEELETDRWISVVRALADRSNYVAPIALPSVHERYSKICYTRVSKVQFANSGAVCKPELVSGNHLLSFYANCTYELEFLTNLDPQLPDDKFVEYRLDFDEALFDVVNSKVEVSKGILRHEFVFRCRETAPHTQIKIGPMRPTDGIYVADTVLPVRNCSTVATRTNDVGPWVLFLVGIYLAMVGVLASPSRLPVDNFLLNCLFLSYSEEIKGLLKFLGIALSSLAGLWAFILQQKR